MASIDFVEDEEDAPESDIDFTPDAPPQPIVARPPANAGSGVYPVGPAMPQPIRPPYQWSIDQGEPGIIPPQPLEYPRELQRLAFPPKRIEGDIMAPLIPLSKLKVSAQTVEDALQALSSASPELTGEESESVLMRQNEPGALAKTAAGVQGSVLRGTESMTSLPMLSTLGLAAAPAAVGRVVSGGFAADMLRHVPEASQRLGEAIESGNTEEIASAASDLAQLGAFATAAGKHAVSPRAPVELPASMQELAKETSTTGVPDALQERSTEAPNGRLPKQPIENEQLPAEEGGGEVPHGTIPPGDTGGSRATEEAGRREVPLTEERFMKAEESPLPERFREKPVADIAESVKDVSSEEITGYQGNLTGGATGFMWDIGARAKTPADVAALRKIAEEASAKTKELMASGDLEGAMKVIGRQPAEAYEFATGVKLDGTPKWDTLEKLAANKGKTYTPPVPDAQYLKAKGLEAPGKVTEASPFEHQKFTTTDENGAAVADIGKLRAAVESGEIKGGEAANPLLSHLLKPSEAHPLKAIKLIDLSPQELSAISGKVAYKGRFTLDRETPAGTIEILTRDANGTPLTHADFVRTLNHELTHNAVTTKIDAAPEAVRSDLQALFDHVSEKAKGTEFEGHNALADVHEFLSEAMSSPKIQSWLTSLEYGGKGVANAFGKFLEIVKRVLRLPDKFPMSALDEAVRVSSELEGIKREAKAAPEERFARSEEERKGLPMAPRAGEAGALSLAPLAPIAKHAMEFVQDVPKAMKVLSAQLAGKSAPKTSVASEASGNALVRYASAKIAAPLVAKEMATRVLGDHYQDADFGQKLGAVLVEDRLRGIKDAFTEAGDTAAAAKVNTLIGQQDSPFQTEAQFRAALRDPEIRAAIRRHKQTVQPVAAGAHEEAGGTLAGPGRHTGAFVNLKAIFEGGEENLLAGGGRGNLMNPLRRPSRFAKKAAGTAEKYETDYRTISERMIEGNFEESTKRQMYDQLVKDGLAELTDPGDPAPEIGGKKAVKLVIERKGVPAGENKARTYVKNLWVREDLAGEVRQALNTDGPIQRAALVYTATWFNRIQLAGPTDAVWHTANMLASIAGSQGGKNVLIDIARKIPGVNITDAIGRTVASSIRVLRDSPDVQKQVAELARIGAMRQKGPPSRLTPLNAMHEMITLVDKSGRLVRDNMYKNLVRRGLVEDTEANRREWVNQMGQYNPRLMGQFQRFFKDAGFSPFVVAGRNFNRMAMRRITLDPGIKAASPAAAAQMRAIEFLGTAATIFAIPALFNYLLTGSPSGRPGTKVGQIDTGKDDNGKHVVIDPAQWTGVRRGLRISGIQAIVEGVRRGETRGRISQEAIRDVIGGIIHPWAGPAVSFGSVAATGYTPTGYKESENPKDYGENIKTALEQLNPLANAYLKGKKEGSGGAKQLGLSLGGAAGLKEVKPFTSINRIGNIHQQWLSTNKDPKIRADYEREQAATFPVTKYKALDDALAKKDEAGAIQAIADLKTEGQKNKEIMARMRPFVGQGANTRVKPLFHESHKLEAAFRNSLTPDQRLEYRKALDERAANWREFLKAWRKRGSSTASAQKIDFVPD